MRSRGLFSRPVTGNFNRVEQAIGACEVEGVPAWLVANFIHTSIAKPDFDAFGGRPMLVFRSTPDVSWALLVKRLIDAVGALSRAALFRVADARGGDRSQAHFAAGRSFFDQLRAGKNGKPFVMYKFRSMSSDAEMRRAELLPFNQMRGPVFKVDGRSADHRLGRWLRRTSMDEMPQLLNVLRGHMSLVGPRPLPALRGGKFRAHRATPAIEREARAHLPLANQRPQSGKRFRRLGKTRSRIHRPLVVRLGLANFAPNHSCGFFRFGCEIIVRLLDDHSRQHALDIFRDDVELDIHQIAALQTFPDSSSAECVE